jgi:dGTP triphosphohydrolase
MTKEYLENTTDERKVIDYIAGMTDEYFLKEYKKYQD